MLSLLALTYLTAAQSEAIKKTFHVTEVRQFEDREAEADCYCTANKIVVYGTAWGTHHPISYQLECSEYVYRNPTTPRYLCAQVEADSDYVAQIGVGVCFDGQPPPPKGNFNLCYKIVSQREGNTNRKR